MSMCIPSTVLLISKHPWLLQHIQYLIPMVTMLVMLMMTIAMTMKIVIVEEEHEEQTREELQRGECPLVGRRSFVKQVCEARRQTRPPALTTTDY